MLCIVVFNLLLRLCFIIVICLFLVMWSFRLWLILWWLIMLLWWSFVRTIFVAL